MSDDDDNNVVPIRDDKGRIVKGQSLNPKGGNRPRFFRDAAGHKFEIEELYRDNAGKVFATLLKLILDDTTPATARISAAKEFNDRAFGRPTATVVKRNEESAHETIDVSSFSPEVLRALAEASSAQK